MKIIKTVEEFKEVRKTFGDKSVGFVPTMGGLHNGHLSLMKRAIAENDISVASVYLNRLRRGMRLQADPTVIYALTDGYGDMRGEPLLRGHLKIDSPYNTYRNKGLPPAPIANVGAHAIRAVMNPADTSYLYFVADGRGGHKFSTDYESHLKNHSDWRAIKKLNNPDVDFENR